MGHGGGGGTISYPTLPHRPYGEACPASHFSLQVLETSLNQMLAVEFHLSLGLLGDGEQEWGIGRSLWPAPLQRNKGSRAGRIHPWGQTFAL